MLGGSTPPSLRAGGLYEIPKRLERYSVHVLVGCGATAFTYLGSEPGPDTASRLKCLKVPSPQLLLSRSASEVRRFFHDEAEALRLLAPANIVPLERVVDLPDDGGVVMLVYAFVDGMNLGALLRKCWDDRLQLPWQSVVDIARDIATALDEAHADRRDERTFYRHGSVVHRDVAPSNVMVSVQGVALLVDFGFARTRMDSALLQASRLEIGRVAYAAPEYGRGGSYGPQLDLFSLGCVLFEALTGQSPFPHGESAHRHIERAWAKDRPRIEDLRGEFRGPGPVDPELIKLVDIIYCLLEPDPAHRFQSAGALLGALSSISVGVDRRDLADLVRHYQEPWQHCVSTGRIDRAEIREKVEAIRGALADAPRSLPPEEVLIDRQVTLDLERLAPSPDLDFGTTAPDHPVIPVTDPSPRSRAASGVNPVIPHTRPSHEALDVEVVPDPVRRDDSGVQATRPGPAAAEVDPTPALSAATDRRSHATPSEPPPSAPFDPSESSVETGPPRRSFGLAHADLPALPGSRASTTGIRRAALAFGALAVCSLCVLTGLNTLWVPLLTGQLGWTVLDGFWTPLLTRLGIIGLAIAALGGAVTALRWWRRRSDDAD